MKTFGKAEKSEAPRKAPKIKILPKDKPMYMKESDSPAQRKSPMLPMKQKRLSKQKKPSIKRASSYQ